MHPNKNGKKRPHLPLRPSLTHLPNITSLCERWKPRSHFKAGNTKPIDIKQATYSVLKKKRPKTKSKTTKHITLPLKDSTLRMCTAPLWLSAANKKGTGECSGYSFLNEQKPDFSGVL